MMYNVTPGFSLPDKVSYSPNITHLASVIQVIANLIVTTQHPEFPPAPGQLSLSAHDIESLHGKTFFPTVIEDGVGVEHLERIIRHVIPRSRTYSKYFIFILRDGIVRAAKNPSVYIRLISLIQDYADADQYWRVDVSLLECLRIIKRSKSGVRVVMEDFLNARMRENELVRRWLERHLDLIPPELLQT